MGQRKRPRHLETLNLLFFSILKVERGAENAKGLRSREDRSIAPLRHHPFPWRISHVLLG